MCYASPSRVMRVKIAMLLLGFLTLSGCGEGGPDKRAGMTQREKDSVLGQSQIPGAKAVKTGMRNADSASARQARLDSADREP
jgi:hypothetical protein